MEDNTTRKWLYDSLTKKGYNLGSYDDYNSNADSDESRQWLYNSAKDAGLEVGTYEQFNDGMGAFSKPVQDFQPRQEVKDYALNNIPDMFKSKGNNLSTRPLQTQEDFSGDSSNLIQRIATDENQRIEQAERAANDPYMRQQELEHVFKPKNQEQINTVKGLINTARMERARERQRKAASVDNGSLFSTLSQAYVSGEMNDTDNQLDYAATLIEQAQNITDEAKKKGKTNFFSGFARGFRDAPLDGWAMGLQDLKNYSAAKKVMDKVDNGEKLNPAEDALMQALVTNAATHMYYAGDLGRGYKAGGVTAESLPFMLDMIAGMGTVQALTKPASKALVKYATEKAAQYGLKSAGTGLAKGAARTVAGLGDVAAHTATFGSQRVAADYQRRGLGDIQVKPNEDGTVSYDGRENIQTGGEAIGKAIVSTAAETGSELLGEYFGPMLGWIGRATGANRIGKIIPASVGKAYSSLVNSQGFKQVQEIARRAKIADPIGEYGEEVVNNLISTAIGDMTPEQLVDLDQNIDTFLGVAPMSALFGAAGTAGYLRGQYRNYRNMRQFENRMQEEIGEDWSGVREALQDADIETAREMVKDVLSSGMTPQLKKDAITYISSVLQEQTLQNADKQSMPEDIAQAKRDILTNLSNTRRQIQLSDEQLGEVMSRVESQGPSALDEMGFTPEQQDMIMSYNDAYQDYNNYTFWVQDTAQNARRQAEQQVESLTNATTGTVMRVKAGFSQEPVNILRGNIAFDAEGKVDREKSDNVVYYLDKNGKVQMSSIDAIENVIDDSPAEEVAAQAGNDAENEVLQSEEVQINPPIELGTVFRNNGQNLIVARKTPQGYEIAAVDDNGELIPEVATQEVSEEDLRNAIAQSSTEGQITNNTETAPEQPVSTETQPESPAQGESSETSQEQEPQTALSRIPTNEKGEQDFEAAPAEDTGAALMEISEGDIDDAKDTVNQVILSYQEQLKKAEKKKTTGANIQEIIKKKSDIRQINDKIRYWQFVSDAIEKKRPGGIIAEAKKVSDENQQRLASMTPQEQSEAQSKVQENIDKGVYDRPSQKRAKTRYVKEDNELGQANTPMEHVLREIATGRVSFLWNDNGTTQGLGKHLGYSDSSAERKKLIWAFSNETGMTPEAASEAIHADMPENLQGMVTDQDIFNMIVQAFQEYGSPSKMWKAAKEMHGTDEIESMPGYRQDIERQALEWEASENNMTVQEWIAYCDFIEEELDNMFSSVSDEELNTIFEQIYYYYERRNETESAGSTQGQTDSEQGNTVQPERESDNEGRTGEVEEQPEPANKTDGESGSVVPEPGQQVNDGPVIREVNIESLFDNLKKKGTTKLSDNFISPDETVLPDGTRIGKINEHQEDFSARGRQPSTVRTYRNAPVVGRDGVMYYSRESKVVKSGKIINSQQGYVLPVTQTNDKDIIIKMNDYLQDNHGINIINYGWEIGFATPISDTVEDAEKLKNILDEAYNYVSQSKGIEAARAEVEQNPTEAQKEAGNYKKGHVKIDGFDITIENPKGSVRSGKDADSNEWSVTMNNDYGYIRGTEGVDGDHIDVFLSDNPDAGDVFVIDQVNANGRFDEHKVMYGFKSELAAKRAYLANYSAGWKGLGNITRVTKEEFRKWIDSSNRKTKPFAEYKSVKQAASTEEGQNRIVSSARYEELKKRMREKLNQLNAGIDPEIIAIGAEMAVYHIERGAIKFADYAKAMVSDLGDVIRPYLKAFYNAVRDMPQAEENGLVENMTPYEEVRAFDVTNFDKKTPDVMQQIQNVAKEKEIEKVAEESRKKTNEAKIQEVDVEGLFESLKKDSEARLSDHIKKPESELSGDSAQYQEKQIQEREAVNSIGTAIREKALKSVDGIDSSPLTMKDVKNILKDYSMLSDISVTDMQELVELAMTNETRNVALKYINSDKQKFGYDIILAMYNMQPLLNARDSTRFEKQQYSTPTPFGYVMGQFVQAGRPVESVLEPSAGNGALTITFPSEIVHVNDIDERRLDNLRTLGYKEVTNRDALLPFDESVDAVMTNPPFGTTTAKEFDGGLFKISSLEGLMAINALDSMKDNGRAAIVIGGNTSYRENGAMQSKDMKLFSYLYSHYNVVDVINLDGEMYKRNGTKYDVRIILINGRKTGPFKRIAPPVKSKARAEQVKTFDELYKRIQDDIQSLQQMGDLFDGTAGETRTAEDGRRSENRPVSDRKQSRERTEPVRNPEGIRPDTGRDTMGNAGNEQPGRTTEERTTGGMDNAVRPDAGSTQPVQEQQRPVGGTDTGRGSSDGSVQSDSGDNTSGGRLSVNLGDEKVPYPNRSQSGTLMSVVPANQAQVLADSLADIGDVDQFLVDELGYSSKEELYSYLAAEQIDSVSLAINQMNKGNGFIIGDMTGVGKGRQGAALIRYAVRKGYKPIYFTQKPALFADNYRDLSDIGSGELRPFIIASSNDGQITDAQGNVVHKIPSKKEVKRVYDYIKENGTLPEEYDYAIITYSQIQNGTSEYEASTDGIKVKSKNYKKNVPAADISGQERRDVIQALSRNNIMILDESHTVGGSGGGSMFMQYILPDVKGVTFLSATFAKRADNMPIYAMKTDLSKSGISPQEMIEAIANGGVTLQEIMSKQLVQSGQMIRRERSFQGVTIDWLPVNEEEDAVQRTQFDEVSSIFSDIRAFQKDFITPMVSSMSDELAEEGGYSDLQKGTKELGVTNVPFASKMYNLVNQLLFSLKADAVANRVIWNLKNGFKPVISFTNTMEGFLEEAPKDTPMEKVPNFSLTLMKALDGVMRYSVNDIEGKSEANQFSVSELSEAGQNRYYEIKEKIENLSANLPISPMDAIKMKIEEAGYKVGEITGRNLEMVRDENGMYVIRNRKDTDKKAAARDFNNGNLDVLMINKSGSTGISLHASTKFEDQRQRVMVFAQFQSDINDEVQMRGRIDRTGQKFRGKYEYIMSSIPAEQRLQMMFKAKLKSLDANTTSSQKSKFNEMQVVDFLNKYGDEVVFQYMQEHPELSEKLGDPLGLLKDNEAGEGNVDNSKRNDCAAKIARYLPFLPVNEQEEVFKDITDAYSVKIQLLNDAGENDLEITTMPLRAETKSRKIWKRGTDPESGNAFADNIYLEEVEVDVLKKPMKAEEIRTVSDRMTDGKPFDEWKEEKVSEINSVYDGKIQTLKERLSSSAEERAQKAKEKYINSAKKAREKGNNEFTDEEIETMSQVAYNEVIKAADESLAKQSGVIERRRENMLKVIEAFTPMKPLVVPFDLTEETATLIPSIGTFLGFKFSKDFSPSSSTAVFSVLDGRRKVEIPFTQEKAFSNIRMNTMMQPTLLKDVNMENWDSRAPKKTRRKAYIVTGNLLQALVDTQKSFMKGYLVSYSTMDGETRQGILMPDNFKPDDLKSSAPISSKISSVRSGEQVVSEDKRVTVEKNTGWRTGYSIKVPKSRKTGGEFFEDKKLRSLVNRNEFETKGMYMVANFEEDNLDKVMKRLSDMGVTVSQKAKLENSEGVRYREEENLISRSIVDRETNELAKKYFNEDLSKYPYEDRRTDKNKEGEVYYGYSEPMFKEENLMDSEFVPEVIKDIVRNNEYEIDPKDITDTLQKYIESEGGPEEEFARPFVDAFEWFNENRKDIRMSDKVNLIVDRNDARMRDIQGTGNTSIDLSEGMKREVEKISDSLHVPVEVITSTDQIKDESVRKAIESGRKIKGWYSLSDRKVYVYLPNTSGVEDAKQTILHEGVAHFGLRKLVGDENMDSFLDEIFANVTKEVREEIISTLPRYGWDSRVATEEYLASMAEQGADVTVWQRIIQAFKNLLRKIGIRMEINDKELRYILWRSRQNLESGNVLDMAKDIAMQYEMGVGNYYREVEQTPEQSTVDAWDKIASSTMFNLRESAVDYLTAVDKFQELISKRSGEEIKPFENAYDSMTFLSSKNRVEMDWFDSNIVTPMRKAILALVGKQKGRKWDWGKGELRRLVMYVEAKHGTERNRQMAVEKFIKEFRPESLKFFENAGISIDRKKYDEELDSIKEKARKKAYEKSFRKIYDNLVKEGTQKEEAEKEAKKRADAIALIAESNASEKFWNDSRGKLMKEYTEKFMSEWNDIKKRISEKKDMSWIEKQKELDKEASRLGADLTQDYSGLSSVFGDENTYPQGWYEESMNFVDEYEKSHEKKDIDGLWKSISDATGYTLNKQYESGLVSKEYVETQKKRFENYIPLRGFQDEIAGDVYNYIGNDFYPGSNPVKSAGGRTSEPGNPFGSILNTGYSTISVGNKNLAKMSFFSLVNNHDTEGLAVAGRAWAVKYDRLLEDKELREILVMPDLKEGEDIPEWVEAVPKYPDSVGYNTNDGSKNRTSPVTDMSSEGVAKLLGRFEEVMKKNSKEGYAKPISKKSKIAYRTLYNERSEHEIPLFILGDKYVITITGNPRVAQAMNGLLNPNVNNKGWSEFGEKVQRFMAGAITAKNAAFSIGNLSKDSIYANNQVFIKENTSYWLRFTKNQKGGFGDFIPMMIRLKNYRDGKLDMSDKSDVMFKEFMDNGGATGYTFVDTQEKYAKELADKLKELSRKTPGMIDPRKITKAFFDSVEFTGQAAELVNRFAAYRTSREMGRSVNRSIRDAKEITVNFNRKGAGMKSWNDNKSVFSPLNTAAFLSQYGRSSILFWNANMQGKYRFYRNIKEHPIKTTTTLIGNSMLFSSVLIPFMNNFALPALYEMFGCGSEDDDEDYYNSLTDWERTRNICVRLPHGNWLKIPISPDMSPWFTMGDCIGGAITGQRELSASDFIKAGIDAISPLPINWSYEGPNVVLNVLPTIFQAGAQVAMNVNFMGNPIRKQPFTMRQGFEPQYTMVYGNTSPTLIELSRLSNRLTGGNDRKTSGSLDWNPADIQNLITGYTGGYGSSFLSAADWIVSTLKGEEQSTTVGKMPLVSRFFISGNKDVKMRRVNSSFYDVIRFTEEFKFDQKSLEDEIQNALKEGNKEKAIQSGKDLEELLNSDRAKKFIELESIVEAAKDFDRYMKEIPDDENTQGIVYEIKMKGIERLKQK